MLIICELYNLNDSSESKTNVYISNYRSRNSREEIVENIRYFNQIIRKKYGEYDFRVETTTW